MKTMHDDKLKNAKKTYIKGKIELAVTYILSGTAIAAGTTLITAPDFLSGTASFIPGQVPTWMNVTLGCITIVMGSTAIVAETLYFMEKKQNYKQAKKDFQSAITTQNAKAK